MTPEEIQFTANFLYLSYSIALLESKVRQFSTPITRLNQSVRKNIASYKEISTEISTLKTLIDRLSCITGARAIYAETLNTCMTFYNKKPSPTVHAALEKIQCNARQDLHAWASEKSDETAQQLNQSCENISTNIQHLQQIPLLYKNMSTGIIPFETPEEYKDYKSIVIIDATLQCGQELLAITDNIINTSNETSDYATHIIDIGAEIYKSYYQAIHQLIMSPTFDKHYATTMFGMHDVLPTEYTTELPHPAHVFEHVLQTTKLYTQTEFLQQQ